MSERNTNRENENGDPKREGKYLTFLLSSEEYGIGILTVKEIIGMMPITPVPRTPEWVLGIINLRGKVIPVVDLRMKFGMEPKPFDDRTCIVVVEVRTGEGLLHIGLVVDSVNEVANVLEKDVENTPNFGSGLDTEYILGMAKDGDHVRILLDIDRVLSGEAINTLQEVA